MKASFKIKLLFMSLVLTTACGTSQQQELPRTGTQEEPIEEPMDEAQDSASKMERGFQVNVYQGFDYDENQKPGEELVYEGEKWNLFKVCKDAKNCDVMLQQNASQGSEESSSPDCHVSLDTSSFLQTPTQSALLTPNERYWICGIPLSSDAPKDAQESYQTKAMKLYDLVEGGSQTLFELPEGTLLSLYAWNESGSRVAWTATYRKGPNEALQTRVYTVNFKDGVFVDTGIFDIDSSMTTYYPAGAVFNIRWKGEDILVYQGSSSDPKFLANFELNLVEGSIRYRNSVPMPNY